MAYTNQHIILSDLFSILAHQENYSWKPLQPGVEICELYRGVSTGPTAALVRYAPGAQVPLHLHQGVEFILVLSGSQSDESGTYPAGTIVANQPGTSHQVSSITGCIVLAIWEKPVKFI